MWQKPWKFKEGILIGSGLVVTGLLLQFTAGPVYWATFAWPANIIVLAVVVALLIGSYFLLEKSYILRWLTSYHAAVCAMLFAVVLTILMGVTRQYPAPDPEDFLGMHYALSCWPFVLIYLWVTVIVGLTTVKQVKEFKWRHWPAIVSHCGLLLVLVCGTLGSADMQRLKMYCEYGKPEWRALDNNNKVHELPIAIQLDSFIINEYPPKLTLVDNKTMKAVEVGGKPYSVLIDDKFKHAEMGGWTVSVEEVIDDAAPKMTQDTTVYVNWPVEGAATAVLVKASPRLSPKGEGGKALSTKRGWVTCGSYRLPSQMLTLDDKYSIGMSQREPQRFASRIQLLSQEGDNIEATIEVNKPYTLMGWKIYQYSYNEQMGKWSNYSVFELVSDPWLPAVYVGIGMLFIGAIGMFFCKKPHPQPLPKEGSENSKD